MTPAEFRAARESLRLRQSDLDRIMHMAAGYTGKIERGDKPIRALHALAMQALLMGHRPEDWPKDRYQHPRSRPERLCASTAAASRSVSPSMLAASSGIARQPAQSIPPLPVLAQPVTSIASSRIALNLIACNLSLICVLHVVCIALCVRVPAALPAAKDKRRDHGTHAAEDAAQRPPQRAYDVSQHHRHPGRSIGPL